MRTPLSIQDLAVLTALLHRPLEKSVVARRALRLVGGATFDEAVAVATVDRLVGLGTVRKVGALYEIPTEGRMGPSHALQDHREALEAMSRLSSPRLVEDRDRAVRTA